MNWIDDYKSKLRTPAEAVDVIRSGDRVYYGGNAAIPQALVRALAERRDSLENVQLNHVLLLGDDPLSAPGMEGHFRHNSLFVGRPIDDDVSNACVIETNDTPCLSSWAMILVKSRSERLSRFLHLNDSPG